MDDDIDKSYAKGGDETDNKSIDSSRSAEEEEDEEVCFFTNNVSYHKKSSIYRFTSFVIVCPPSTSDLI